MAHFCTKPLLRVAATSRLLARQRTAVERAAADFVDREEQILSDPRASDHLRTKLEDDLKIGDADVEWKVQWRRAQEEEARVKEEEARRLEEWQRGELKAGSRESSKDRTERMFQEGRLPSSEVPPHPPDFESIVRRVRYAHLMPRQRPKRLGKSLFTSKVVYVMASLVDRLLELPGVTLETLRELPLQEQDKLLLASYEAAVPPVLDGKETPSLGEGMIKAVESTSSSVAPAEAQEPSRSEVTSEDVPSHTCDDQGEERDVWVEEVFKGQAALEGTADDWNNKTPGTTRTVQREPAIRLRKTERKPEKVLTATQTIDALFTLISQHNNTTNPAHFWVPIIQAAGGISRVHARYFFQEAVKELGVGNTDFWTSYLEAVRDPIQAGEVIEEMKEQGVTPSVHTWAALMRIYTSAGDASSAVKVEQNMRMYANLDPNHESFKELMNAHGRDETVGTEARARRVQNTFYEMTQVYRIEPDRDHYALVLLALAGAVRGSSEWYLELLKVADQMKYAGFAWGSYEYFILLNAEHQRGDLDRTKELVLTMRKRNIPIAPNAIREILCCYSRVTDESSVWFKKYKAEWERSFDTEIDKEEMAKEKLEEARQVFQVALKKFEGHPDVGFIWEGWIEVCARLNRPRLREVWRECPVRTRRSYMKKIHGMVKMAEDGDPHALDDAEATFVEMVKKGIKPTVMTYFHLMKGHISSAREGSVEVALDYMKALERSGRSLAPWMVGHIKNLVDKMGPKRDAIRRARNLMERRNSLAMQDLFTADQTSSTVLAYPGEPVRGVPGLTPDGFAFPGSPTGVNPDGTLAGEKPEERAAALAQMGHQPMNIENAQQIRTADKVGDWLRHSAKNPHLNFSPEHPSFDKIINSPQFKKMATAAQRDVAINPWHLQQMAQRPEAFNEDGTPKVVKKAYDPTADDKASALQAMAASRGPADIFDEGKPYFDPTYAHTMADPQGWTEGQEAFMKDWVSTASGKEYMQAMSRAQRLRRAVDEQRKIREAAKARGVKDEKYADEVPGYEWGDVAEEAGDAQDMQDLNETLEKVLESPGGKDARRTKPKRKKGKKAAMRTPAE